MPDADAELSHLVEEFNIFKLEGLIFDLTRKHDRYRADLQTGDYDASIAPVQIEPHPNYGRPGVGAFKALQAIFFKLTEEGFPYPDTVSFTRREFERLRGSSAGGYQVSRTYHDLRQLETCEITCSRKDKESGEWQWGTFRIIAKSWWSSPSGTKRDISKFALQLDDNIVRNLNEHYYARFNWYRLRELMSSPIAVILYKRFFQHFAGLMGKDGNPAQKTFEKDYDDVCREWLGGLKPERYKSDILGNQLGRHIEAIHKTRLGRISIEKRKKGGGFKLVFSPRKGFFEDYQNLYENPRWRPQLPFNRVSDKRNIQEPLQLVDYFYRQVGVEKETFRDAEIEYANELLNDLTYAEVEQLIDVAVRHSRQRNFDPYSFTILKNYLKNWKERRDQREQRRAARDRVNSCELCNHDGFLLLVDPNNTMRSVTYECPHDEAKVEHLEVEKGLRRFK
jgi:hypothetical protein